MAYTFLSDEWVAASQKAKEEVGEIDLPPMLRDLRVNMTITEGPDGDKDMHMGGGPLLEPGHLSDAPAKVILPFDVAKAIFIDQNSSAAMNAMSRGQLKIEGDASKVMGLAAAGPPNEQQQRLNEKLKEITA